VRLLKGQRTLSAKNQIHEFCKTRNGDVRFRLGRFDRSDPGKRGRAVHPDGRKAQSLSWNDVVINALPYMEDAVRRCLNSAERQLKEL
jgi:hypothetical protein